MKTLSNLSFSLFIFAIVMSTLFGCQTQTNQTPISTPIESPAVTLNIFAAASLKDAFTEIGKSFETAHPGTRLVFNFGGSQQLVQQLNNGAPADVFTSANTAQMDAAVKGGRIGNGVPVPFVNNRLVMIVSTSSQVNLSTLTDLAQTGIKLVLADKQVPVGNYALQFLDKASKDPGFSTSYKDDVLKNVVSYEQDVKAVLTKVTLGEADAGIVYTTDVAGMDASKVKQVAIPDALNVIAVYPIAAVKDSQNIQSAQAFIDFVLNSEGQRILQKFGFLPPNP